MAYYFGDALGQTYAGFPAANIAAYFRVSTVAAQGIINLANGAKLTDAQRAAVLAIGPNRFKPGATGPNQGYGDITWGLAHLAQHPMGSHYHGGIGNIFKNIALNVATGGLYGVAKGAISIATGGKVISGLKTAMANFGPAGEILTPIVGENKSLLLQTLVAGPALAIAAPAMLAPLVSPAVSMATSKIVGPTPSTISLPVQGAGPSGQDPRYNPGYASTPLDQQYNPAAADSGFGPDITQTDTAQAGFLGGLSPIMLVGLFGVPLLIQFLMKGRKK